MSSTLGQCLRRGWAVRGMMRVLILGNSTFVRALLSAVVILPPVHSISSVWRFGRDRRHLTSKEVMGPCSGGCIFMNLHKKQRISARLREKMGGDVLHACSKKRVRGQKFRDDVQPPHNLFLRCAAGFLVYFNMFPHPWQQPQPHRFACRA